MSRDGWTTGIREGYMTKTIVFGSATIEIHRPILTAEERSRRETAVIHALELYGRAANTKET